jgi:hypothetical protein
MPQTIKNLSERLEWGTFPLHNMQSEVLSIMVNQPQQIPGHNTLQTYKYSLN